MERIYHVYELWNGDARVKVGIDLGQPGTLLRHQRRGIACTHVTVRSATTDLEQAKADARALRDHGRLARHWMP